MQWYEALVDDITEKDVYSRKELVDMLRNLKADLSDGTYNWILGSLVSDGQLIRQGYDAYRLSNGISKKEYRPDYSGDALGVMNDVQNKYPYVRFTVFETVLMNEFLNHLIANNTIFIQVEKESSIFIFRYLQEAGYQNVLYKPDVSDFDLYWAKGSIIVTNLISESPIRTDNPGEILLEKILVDMLADKLIATTFSKAELPDVFEQAVSRYNLDKVRMFRYARRRNRQDEVKKYMGEQ